MSEWKNGYFLDYIELNPKVVLKKGDLYPFVDMASVDSITRIPISIELKQYTSGVKFQELDTVFARIEPCLQNGKRFLFKDFSSGFGSTEFLVFRAIKNKTTPLFVYYYMQTHRIKNIMINSMTGATGRQRVNNDVFNHLTVKIPSLSIQNRIAEILSRYDSLIENYQKQIKLLEESAQRLYKEWFVDLRFPGHENTKIVDGVPEGWEKKKAQDFFNMSIGKTPPRIEKKWFTDDKDSIPWVSISDMKDITFVSYTSEKLTKEACDKFNVKIIPVGTVILSFKLTVGRVAITSIPMCTNEAIAHFSKEGNNWRAYTFYYLKNYNYDSLGNTSGISKAVNSTIIKNMPFLLPSENILDSFEEHVNSYFARINNISTQIQLLTEARDRLLPKLMSGEIEV